MIRFWSIVYHLQFLTDGMFSFSVVLTIDLFSTLRKIFPFEVLQKPTFVDACGYAIQDYIKLWAPKNMKVLTHKTYALDRCMKLTQNMQVSFMPVGKDFGSFVCTNKSLFLLWDYFH